jgi:hypothetical protein
MFACVLLYSLVVAALPRILDETSIRLALRMQARLSFVLFIAALAGPGLRRFWPGRFSETLVRERSTLLLAFALSHFVHGIWICIFYAFTPHAFSWNLAGTTGVIAYALIGLLVFAELPVGQRALGRHVPFIARGVLGYLWIQFAGFFAMQLVSGKPQLFAWYFSAIVLSVAAALLAWLGTRASPSGRLPPSAPHTGDRRLPA